MEQIAVKGLIPSFTFLLLDCRLVLAYDTGFGANDMDGFPHHTMNYKAAMALCPDFNCIGMVCIGPTDPNCEYWKAVHVLWKKSCIVFDAWHGPFSATICSFISASLLQIRPQTAGWNATLTSPPSPSLHSLLRPTNTGILSATPPKGPMMCSDHRSAGRQSRLCLFAVKEARWQSNHSQMCCVSIAPGDSTQQKGATRNIVK